MSENHAFVTVAAGELSPVEKLQQRNGVLSADPCQFFEARNVDTP